MSKAFKEQEFKAISDALTKSNKISIPLGRPNEAQMEALKKRFPEWEISIDPYDPFGAYVNFKRKS